MRPLASTAGIALCWIGTLAGASRVLAEGPAGAKAFSDGLDGLEAADWNAAMGKFSEAIDADEDGAEFYLARGVARVLGEQFPEAEKDLQRALRLKQNDWETKLWLAACYFMSNNAQEASKIFSYGNKEDYPYADVVHKTARMYMESRYMGGYYDPDQRKRVPSNAPVKRDFPKAAKAFVARHRVGGAAESATREKAESSLRSGMSAEALRELEMLLRQKPGDAKVLEMHARAALSVGDALTARREMTALLTANTRSAASYQARASAAAMLGDVARVRADIQIAHRYGDTAIALSPIVLEAMAKSPPPRERMATLSNQLQEQARLNVPWPDMVQTATELLKTHNSYRLRADEAYQDRLRLLLEATTERPKDAAAFADLGSFLYEGATQVRGESVEPRAPYMTFRAVTDESVAEELNRAEAALNMALQLDPNQVKALTFKAGCLMWRAKWQEAEGLVKTALTNKATSPELLEVLSQILDHAAGVKSARATNLRSVDSWSDFSYIYWRYPSERELKEADEFSRQAKELWALSRQYMEAAAKAAAGTALGHYYDGVIARRDGNIEAARAAFEKAAEMAPDMIKAHDQLSAIYSAAGLTEKAHEQQAAASNLVQTTAGPMLRLAWIETVRTARKGARDAATKAWALDASDPRCPAYLGVIEKDAEKYDAAIQDLRVALAMLEARTRFHGQSLEAGAKGAINDVDLGLAMAMRLCLGEAYDAAGRNDDAMETYQAITALQPRVDEEQLRGELVYGMLPDPAGDQNSIPKAQRTAYYFGLAHARLGATALKVKKLDEAEQHFAAVRHMQTEWPMTAEGRECLDIPSTLARLGSVGVLMSKGRIDEARALFRREGWPWSLPKDIQQQIKQVEHELKTLRD